MDSDTLERPAIEVVEVPTKGPQCELSHDECTHTAVALGHPTCGGYPIKLICQAQVEWYEYVVSEFGVHKTCGRFVKDCWHIVGI